MGKTEINTQRSPILPDPDYHSVLTLFPILPNIQGVKRTGEGGGPMCMCVCCILAQYLCNHYLSLLSSQAALRSRACVYTVIYIYCMNHIIIYHWVHGSITQLYRFQSPTHVCTIVIYLNIHAVWLYARVIAIVGGRLRGCGASM